MNERILDTTRLWAMVVGLVLAGWYFGEVQSGIEPSQVVPVLVAAIGGFELFLSGQDYWLKRKGKHG